ncbi:hypothetical protein B0H10DRAFT_506896 [Mycena sp. CBHHK59/15]|nr:hypothetical protein B0H10DRAFT_506896 [Mycena sp. CBHHK59/15]
MQQYPLAPTVRPRRHSKASPSGGITERTQLWPRHPSTGSTTAVWDSMAGSTVVGYGDTTTVRSGVSAQSVAPGNSDAARHHRIANWVRATDANTSRFQSPFEPYPEAGVPEAGRSKARVSEKESLPARNQGKKHKRQSQSTIVIQSPPSQYPSQPEQPSVMFTPSRYSPQPVQPSVIPPASRYFPQPVQPPVIPPPSRYSPQPQPVLGPYPSWVSPQTEPVIFPSPSRYYHSQPEPYSVVVNPPSPYPSPPEQYPGVIPPQQPVTIVVNHADSDSDAGSVNSASTYYVTPRGRAHVRRSYLCNRNPLNGFIYLFRRECKFPRRAIRLPNHQLNDLQL